MMAVLKRIEAIFDHWQFFMGESMNLDGMLALMDFRDDEVLDIIMCTSPVC